MNLIQLLYFYKQFDHYNWSCVPWTMKQVCVFPMQYNNYKSAYARRECETEICTLHDL